MKIKIRGGTRSDGKFLCETCSNGTVMRGPAEGQEAVYCGAAAEGQVRVPFRVVECTSYRERGARTAYDYAQIGWVLETSKTGRTIGFAKPAEWRARHKGEEVVPD